jgi:HK97 family phage portal protein
VIFDRLVPTRQQKDEERAISFQSLFALGDGYTFTTNSGVYVTQEDSLKIGSVYACVRLIADTIASLPVDSYIRQEGVRLQYRPRPAWLDAPDIGVTKDDHFQQVLVSLLLNGNSFTRIIRDEEGEVLALSVLNPQRTEVRRDAAGRLFYVYDAKDRIEDVDMIHIKDLVLPGELRGKSRIDLVKENLGLSRALEEFAARFFGQGSSTTGIIQFPGNLSREQAKNLVDAFEDGHRGLRRSHRPGILFGGATFQKTGVDPNESQFLESRQFAVEEIARIFRVPPSMIGVTTPGAMSYASVEANQLSFLQHSLVPYLSKLESEYSVLLAGRAFIRFTTAGLLRGDIAARNASYSSGLMNGYLSVNDVRRFEDMSPIEGGDAYRVPLANIDITAANLADLDRKSLIAQRLVLAGFDPAGVLAALDMPSIEHTGLPSTQLQPLASVSPVDPKAAYEVNSTRELNLNMPEQVIHVAPPSVHVDAPVVNVPETVVNVNVPEQRTVVRQVVRGEDGRITEIVERVES